MLLAMRIAVALVAVLALAGCGGGSSSSSGPSSPAASGPLGILKVTEKEFSISPATLSLPGPGLYVINVVNKGHVTHALAINGHGASVKTKDIAPGGSATLRVNLTKLGSYEVECPIDGHRAKGMIARLVVGQATGAAPGQTST